MTSIGNDIVDLTSPDSIGKSRDRRFIARVFTPEEQERIERSEFPDTTLWMLWAAKEAAFKAVSKLKPGLSFIHRAYAHRDEPGKAAPILLKQTNGNAMAIQEHGVVMTPAGPVDAFFTLSCHRVHCVAAVRNGHGGAPAATPVHVLEERRDGPFDPSATVRRAAIHHLASVLKASPYYIDIRRDKTPRGYGAPRVFIEGSRTDIDISLSHDGQYIAFAVHY
ncbi:MAG: 4'-phosphopantetheinyl transferase superfamily protein [Syntrophales bacterium]